MVKKQRNRSVLANCDLRRNGNERERTVDDPTLYFRRVHLQYRGYLCVRQVLPDILEAEIC